MGWLDSALTQVADQPAPFVPLRLIEWTGGYPAIHHRKIPPAEWLASYVAT